jgi:hypothetical protein
MARARTHAAAAAAETLRALESLLDAAALATGGAPAAGHPVLGQVARVLEGLAAELSPGTQAGSESLLAAVAAALDLEIARWEKRAREDPDARGVLRAFLGLRELLWEFGVRPGPPGSPPGQAPEAASEPGGSPRKRRKPRSPRVQRVRVEG